LARNIFFDTLKRIVKRWLIGVDIGGTKIAVSLGTAEGKLLSKRVLSSRGGKKPRESAQEIVGAVSDLLEARKIKTSQVLGMGLAVAGAVHAKLGMVLKSPNLRRWEKFPLKRTLQRALRIPVWIENDANAAALGEQFFGLGRGMRHFLYITVSTGIGSGMIANGSLVRGESGSAGELGHMTAVPDGIRCACGKRGCLEAYASGTAIANLAKQALRNGAKSRYFKSYRLNDITGQAVCFGALAGDRVAIRARREAADYLGIGLANMINLLNPRRIILGGGVMERVHHFWSPMMKRVRSEAWPSALKSCEIVRSKLGKKVGDLGALAVALNGNGVKR